VALLRTELGIAGLPTFRYWREVTEAKQNQLVVADVGATYEKVNEIVHTEILIEIYFVVYGADGTAAARLASTVEDRIVELVTSQKVFEIAGVTSFELTDSDKEVNSKNKACSVALNCVIGMAADVLR
jgi:hypothetical protein